MWGHWDLATILTASPPPAGPVHAESTSTPRVQETPPTLAKMASLHLPAGRGWAPTTSWLSLCGGWLQGRGLTGAPTKTRHVQEREGAVVTLAQQIRGTVFFFKKQRKDTLRQLGSRFLAGLCGQRKGR